MLAEVADAAKNPDEDAAFEKLKAVEAGAAVDALNTPPGLAAVVEAEVAAAKAD